MSSSQTPVDYRERMNQCVETLAMQVVMGEEAVSSPEAAARSLVQIEQLARDAGDEQLAQMAAGIAGAVSQSSGPPFADTLAEGLQHLQEALGRKPDNESSKGNSLADDPELVSDFILESREHLTTIEAQILAIEQDPHNVEPIHSAFRGFHTIKGIAGFLEFSEIQKVAHEVETVLDLARSASLTMSPEVVDCVLAGADYLKSAINGVEQTLRGGQAVAAPDNRALIARLHSLREAEPADVAESPAPVPEPAQASPPVPAETAIGNSAQNRNSNTYAVRVDTGKLDYLVDMVGELVIAQSMVKHDPALSSIQSPRLTQNLAQMARITGEVQKTVMGVRMVPIGQLFRRTARLVRDLTRKSGKQAELDLSGEEIEIDKTIVEALADPLMHMMRNSVDHGIEQTEDRIKAGKNPVARLALRASHQAGHITIEIADDGRGIDRQKVLKKALERGIIADGHNLSDTEVCNLIFEPGFSTAEQVTAISGRGVGMDVVRKQITKLRGRIEIRSVPGAGTTFVLKLPLTLAIIDGLVVAVGTQRYIVPLFAVREMLRPAPGMISTVENSREMAMVRGRLLPVIRLYKRFDVTPRSEDPAQSLLIVAENGEKPFCLMVDELVGKQEVVIKNLGEILKKIRGVAGGAILGDGRVGLILDMDGIFGAGASV